MLSQENGGVAQRDFAICGQKLSTSNPKLIKEWFKNQPLVDQKLLSNFVRTIGSWFVICDDVGQKCRHDVKIINVKHLIVPYDIIFVQQPTVERRIW